MPKFKLYDRTAGKVIGTIEIPKDGVLLVTPFHLPPDQRDGCKVHPKAGLTLSVTPDADCPECPTSITTKENTPIVIASPATQVRQDLGLRDAAPAPAAAKA